MNVKRMTTIAKELLLILVATALIIGVILPVSNNNALAAKDEDWVYVSDDQCKQLQDDLAEAKADKEKAEKPEKSDEAVNAGGAEPWLTKGTKQYKVAQEVFDVLTKEYGFSGKAASGMMGNVSQESHFTPDIYQDGDYNGLGMNTKPPGNAGGGLVQFTPASKYSESSWWKKDGKDGWDVGNQIGRMWELEWGNRAVEVFMKTKGTKYQTIEEFMKADDVGQAADTFERAYERPLDAHPERQEFAKKINAVFNKDDVKYDESKFKLDGKEGKSSGKTKVDTSDSADKEKAEDNDAKKCKLSTKKKEDEGGSAASWGKDGTGDAGMKAGNSFEVGWMPDQLPKNLKQYAIDPKNVDLGWKNPKNWNLGTGFSTNGQCVNLSTAMFGLIWTKDGKTPSGDKSKQIFGDGAENVSYVEKVYGVKATHKPTKGAIFSAPRNSPMGPSGYGHTGIVSHVFKNGDVLILEQNVGPVKGGGSGDDGGPNNPMTWNYRLVTKEAAATQTYATMDGEKGWKVNEKLTGKK